MTSKQRLSAALVTAAALAIASVAVAAGARPPDAARSTAGASPGPAFPEGVYRVKRSRQDVLRVWPNANAAMLRALTGTVTFTFEHGVFSAILTGGGTAGCRRGDGRYSTKGRAVMVRWTSFHECPLFDAPTPGPWHRVAWTFDGDNLRLRLMESAPPAERVTWESNPLVRIGGRP